MATEFGRKFVWVEHMTIVRILQDVCRMHERTAHHLP